MLATPQLLNNYLADFNSLATRTESTTPLWLRSLRANAFARFCQMGFPTTHNEDWRFTNVSRLAETTFKRAPRHTSVAATQLAPYLLPKIACRLVFINGCFAPELSFPGGLPRGVQVANLAVKLRDDPASVQPHLGTYLDTQRDAFCALNTAFAEDGAFVLISRETVVPEPIGLLFISTANRTPTANTPRNLLLVEDGAQVSFMEQYVSLGEGDTFCNNATELVVGENAQVTHYRIMHPAPGEVFNISTLRIQQSRHSNVSTHSVLLGGSLVRNNIHAVLAGEGSECLLNGLFTGKSREHLDNYMLVEHQGPHSNSRQFYNGLLDGQAHGVFHGRIIVHKDAQKTDAKQTNRNLLLTDDAQIDTKPQLEIYADDVKCTHGATIGQIEQDALFYLRSRGIGETEARKLLLLAFAGESLDRMNPGQARDYVARLIDATMLIETQQEMRLR